MSKESNELTEKCPKCQREHKRGPYYRQHDPKKVKPDNREGICACPNDVDCPCGLTLRWTVPIFKVTSSGYLLRPKMDVETKYDSKEVYE